MVSIINDVQKVQKKHQCLENAHIMLQSVKKFCWSLIDRTEHSKIITPRKINEFKFPVKTHMCIVCPSKFNRVI